MSRARTSRGTVQRRQGEKEPWAKEAEEKKEEVTGRMRRTDNTGSFQPAHRGKVRLPPNCAFWAGAQAQSCLIDSASQRPVCAAVPKLISPNQPGTASTAEKPHETTPGDPF